MKTQKIYIKNLTKLNAKHRKVILDRVVQSMGFENQPVDMARLKTLLKKRNLARDRVNTSFELGER